MGDAHLVMFDLASDCFQFSAELLLREDIFGSDPLDVRVFFLLDSELGLHIAEKLA